MKYTQKKYYGRFLEGAKKFANEITEQLTKQNINIEDKTTQRIYFTDDNNNEWYIGKDYLLGILEITLWCKMMVNNKPKYKSGWVYAAKNNKDNDSRYDTFHLIEINNLRFHIDRTKSLLL